MNRLLKLHPRNIPSEGQSSVVWQYDREILIIKRHGQLYAINNNCTHKQICLADGKIEGNEIICPAHQYRFDLTNGKCNVSGYDTTTYDVIVAED